MTFDTQKMKLLVANDFHLELVDFFHSVAVFGYFAYCGNSKSVTLIRSSAGPQELDT